MASDDSLSKSFQLLKSILHEFRISGRPARGASVKALKQTRSSGLFDQTKLGFAKFKDFLKAAEEAGLIAITEGGPGHDISIHLREEQAPLPQDAGDRSPIFTSCNNSANATIRPDLWSAFTFFQTDSLHFFDRLNQRAYRIPQEANAMEPAAIRSLRNRLEDTSTIIPIRPIPMPTLLQWMKEFAESQPAHIRESLLNALKAESQPHRNFSLAVRTFRGLPRIWHKFHVRGVSEAIMKWANENRVEIPDLSVSVIRASGIKPKAATLSLPPAQIPPRMKSNAVLPFDVLTFIDSTIGELLKLRGALGFKQDNPNLSL
jgi:hypothetical protein